MQTASDHQYLNTIQSTSFQPIFILGIHRSGTSILYKILAATNCFNTVTAYHLINYQELLHNHLNGLEQQAKQTLTNRLNKQGHTDRGIDRLKITADFAEEYGFLLGHKTFLLQITPRNLLLFTEMAQKIQYIAENTKPLLLKNPYDFPNFLYLKQKFPNAKFIFIHRHPYKTLSSSMKALQYLLRNKDPYASALFTLYDKLFKFPLLLYPIRLCFTKFYPLGILFLTRYSAQAIRYYLKNIHRLSKNEYFITTYEDLCTNPQKTITNIMNFLKINSSHTIDFNTYIKPRKTRLDKSVQRLHRFILHRMKPYFTEFNFESDTSSEYL